MDVIEFWQYVTAIFQLLATFLHDFINAFNVLLNDNT